MKRESISKATYAESQNVCSPGKMNFKQLQSITLEVLFLTCFISKFSFCSLSIKCKT